MDYIESKTFIINNEEDIKHYFEYKELFTRVNKSLKVLHIETKKYRNDTTVFFREGGAAESHSYYRDNDEIKEELILEIIDYVKSMSPIQYNEAKIIECMLLKLYGRDCSDEIYQEIAHLSDIVAKKSNNINIYGGNYIEKQNIKNYEK